MWRSLTWECEGETLTFSDTYKAAVFMDFGSFQSGAASGVYDRRSSPGIDGTVTYSASMGGMTATINARVLAFNIGSRENPVENVLDQYHRKLCSLFHPCKAGRLTYTTHNGSYFVEARAASTPGFGAIEGNTLPFTVDLYCDEPYWQSTHLHELNIGISDPAVTFPSEISGETGEILSVKTGIPNTTHNDWYPVIRVWPSESIPMVVNELTGKRIRLNTQVTAGFYVDIDTSPTKNTVNLYRLDEATGEYRLTDNVTHWLTLDSDTDFAIVPGFNTIRAEYVTAHVYPAVTMLWREREVGI